MAKHARVFLGRCVRTAAKAMVVDRKKKAYTRFAIFGVGTAANAVYSSVVPTEFAAEHNKDEVLEGKFRNLNFSSFTKKTNEDWF